MTRRGRFITVEGIDGAGKSSHLEYLCERVRALGHEARLTREPGGTAVGERLRDVVLHHAMTPLAEALVMFGARGAHVATVIEPALAAGAWVVCDRFSDSTYAYQCGGRGLKPQVVANLEGIVHPELQPDATLLFDLDPAIAYERQRARSRTPDRFEREQADFFVRVREAYLERARQHAYRFHVVDAAGSLEEVRGRLHGGIRESAAVKPFPWHHAALARVLAARARLPHALLLHGPTGIGKAEFARALAAGTLCESPRAGLACEACASCHWFSQGNHPDFREIVPEADAEDDAEAPEAPPAAKAEKAKSLVIRIDQVRAVADFVALTTHRGGYRVLLIHPAEALHPAAANALLKTLEEPPPLTLIVMVSDRPARLLATLRSRCRLLPLPVPPPAEALQWLRQLGVAEPETALANAGGAPLLARDLAEPGEAQMRQRLLAELARPSGADAVLFAAGIERGTVERMIYWMQTWVHDLVRTRLAGEARHHGDFSAALRARARAANLEALFELERTLTDARRLAAHPLNARLLAEHLLMAYNRATSGSMGP